MNEEISRAEDVDDMFAISSSEQHTIQTESTMCREDQEEANCSSIGDDDSSTSSCASIDTNVFSRDIDDDEELGAPKFSPKGKVSALREERR